MAKGNTLQEHNNERGGTIMDAENITWVITLESGKPEVKIVRKNTAPTVLECPSEREMKPAEWDSGLYLSRDKGVRINMIRIIYALCREQVLVDARGNRIPDCRIFQSFGHLLHTDLSNYLNDLNRSMEENTRIETQTKIFRNLSDNLIRRFDSLS